MAPRLDGTDNVGFLLKCIDSSNIKIDFNKAAAVLNTTPNAARMRYSRLRKSSQDDHNCGVAVTTPPTVRRIVKPKKFAESKKRKRQSDDESLAETDHMNDEDDLPISAPGRAARGPKIDYSTMFSEGESLDDFNDNEKSSNFDNEVSVQNKSSLATVHAPPHPMHVKPPTPPKSKTSVKRNSMSPEFLREAPAPNDTPPQSIRRTKIMKEPLREDTTNISVDLSALKSGQKLQTSMFKRSRAEFAEQDMGEQAVGELNVMNTSSDLARTLPVTPSMELQGDHMLGGVSMDGGISYVNRPGRREDMEDTEEESGRTFMQRLSALWN